MQYAWRLKFTAHTTQDNDVYEMSGFVEEHPGMEQYEMQPVALEQMAD